MSLDLSALRSEFPALTQKVRGHDLVYLDSGATALKPRSVIKAIENFYSFESANVHRGAHYLSDRATEKYELSRKAVQSFLNAKSSSEIVFTSGTTDSINLVAQAFGKSHLQAGDEILLTQMEHHSNIVPWQMVAEERDAKVLFARVTDAGELDWDDFEKKLSPRTKLVSLVHCSNTLGTVNDIKKAISLARSVNAKVVIDAAQSVSFMPIDVQNLDCDFLAFSAHKIYGPYGVGVLYGKEDILNALPPYRGGGSMIDSVTEAGTSYLPTPHRFEAGTPNISGIIALKSAIDFLGQLGFDDISRHEKELTHFLLGELRAVPGISFVGKSDSRVNIVSFNIEGLQSSDIGAILDQQGVAVRTGHHCTQPLLKRFGINATLRVSFGVYNDISDVKQFIKALHKALEILT